MNRILHSLTLLLLITSSACGSRTSDLTPSNMSTHSNPLPPCPDSPNCVRISKHFAPDADSLFAIIGNSLKAIGADSLNQNQSEHSYHAVFRIPVFGWKDDVHVQVGSTDMGSVAHFRSASRIGYSDLGINKRRVRKLIKHIQSSLN